MLDVIVDKLYMIKGFRVPTNYVLSTDYGQGYRII